MSSHQHRHVIVDGYNVVFGDDGLKKLFRQSQEEAKQALISLAQSIHDVDGHQVSVVFDGQGTSIGVELPLREDSFTVIHSTSQLSADGVIERMLLRSKQPQRLIVVTNDRLIQSATLACEAEPMRVERFLDWVTVCERKGRIQVIQRKKAADQDWGNHLPL